MSPPTLAPEGLQSLATFPLISVGRARSKAPINPVLSPESSGSEGVVDDMSKLTYQVTRREAACLVADPDDAAAEG